MRAILRELLGLFVDDGFLALTILLWLGIVRLLPPGAAPAALFAGLAAILLETTLRRARKDRTE